MDAWLGQHIAVLEGTVDGREAVFLFLRSIATMLADQALPGGCFVIIEIADFGAAVTPQSVELALRKPLSDCERVLANRIQRARRERHVSSDIAPADLAAFYYVLVAGLGVKAKSGARRSQLYAAIDVGMRAWPAP